MERSNFNMHQLFAQLGQASDDVAMAGFFASHGPLAGEVRLHEASFWTPSQAGFLREALNDDAEWAEIVDALNVELHTAH